MWMLRRFKWRTMGVSAFMTMCYTIVSFLENTQLDQSSDLPPLVKDGRSVLPIPEIRNSSSSSLRHSGNHSISEAVDLIKTLLELQTFIPQSSNQSTGASESVLEVDVNEDTHLPPHAEEPHPVNLGSGANYNAAEINDFIQTFFKYNPNIESTFYALNVTEPYNDFIKRLSSHKKRGVRLMQLNITDRPLNSRERFLQGMSQYQLYDPYDGDVISDLLKDLSTQPIVAIEPEPNGNQFKMKLKFADGGGALSKPIRVPREVDAPEHIPYYELLERHNAEIAASYLDRVLGFYRAPPVVGRLLDMKTEILDLTSSWLATSFFNDSDGRTCFIGQCYQFCDADHPICGSPDKLEVSVAVLFPGRDIVDRTHDAHPWQRSYNISQEAAWETDETWCDREVRAKSPYTDQHLLLHYMDLAVYDFLIGNMDRHHVGGFLAFWPDTYLLHFDHGRGFARASSECPTCIAPVRQCCLIRYSTLVKLIKLYRGPDSLSEVMRTAMNSDLLAPILTEPHLDALDRRVTEVLRIIANCIKGGRKWEDVILDDGVV